MGQLVLLHLWNFAAQRISSYIMLYIFQNTSKFWILQKHRHRDCQRDVCWRELLFPFTHNKDGDNIHYAVMSGVVLLPVIFGFLCFTRDFWWINPTPLFFMLFLTLQDTTFFLEKNLCNSSTYLSIQNSVFIIIVIVWGEGEVEGRLPPLTPPVWRV